MRAFVYSVLRIIGATAFALGVMLTLTAADLAHQPGTGGGGGGGLSASLFPLLTGGADAIFTGPITFNGVIDDIQSSSNTNLTLKATGTGKVDLQGGTSGTSTLNLRNISDAIIGTVEIASSLTWQHTVAAAGSFFQLQGSGGWVRVGQKTDVGASAPILAITEGLSNDRFYFWGDGSMSIEAAVTSLASGDCDANGEVGRIWKYSKNSGADINLCACSKQGSAFSYKALTAGGDCT